MSTELRTLRDAEQANLSEAIRTNVKRLAAGQRRGLRDFAAATGLPYCKAWNQLNRGQGVLVDLLPAMSKVTDEPLRQIADACGYDIAPKPVFLRRTKEARRPVRSHALAIHHAAAAVTLKIEDALADERIDEREREAIKSALHKLRISLAGLEERICGHGPAQDIAPGPGHLTNAALATRIGTQGKAER